MIVFDDIPEIWKTLLSNIASALGPTVLAGGALRDLDNGRPVKDLDFFVKCGTHANPLDDDKWGEVHRAEAALRAGVPGLEVVNRIDPEYAEAFRDEIKYVWTCTVPGVAHELQIILGSCETLKEAVDRVDFGLCMIGFDGATLYRSREYLADQAAGIFTLYRADNATNHERSLKRYKRFTEKYPGWPMQDVSPMGQFAPVPTVADVAAGVADHVPAAGPPMPPVAFDDLPEEVKNHGRMPPIRMSQEEYLLA